jgi:hypothetical protein
LILSVSPPTSSPRLSSPPGRVFEMKSNSPFAGIIAGFTSSCGGNVHERGLVSITDSSHHSDPYRGKASSDLENAKSYLQTDNSPGQWFCYDFKNSRVSLTHYSIRTCLFGGGQ